MKRDGRYTGFIDRVSIRFRQWSRPLQATAIALLLVLPIAGNPANAAAPTPAPEAHVYLLRGVLNIFSLGLDDIAARLRQQGIHATVENYLSWESLADEAAAEYRSGRVRTIILVGHSSGATVLPNMAARLDQLGAPVTLAIGLDSVFQTSVAGHVGRYLNFYVANGDGTQVQKIQGIPRRRWRMSTSAEWGSGTSPSTRIWPCSKGSSAPSTRSSLAAREGRR